MARRSSATARGTIAFVAVMGLAAAIGLAACGDKGSAVKIRIVPVADLPPDAYVDVRLNGKTVTDGGVAVAGAASVDLLYWIGRHDDRVDVRIDLFANGGMASGATTWSGAEVECDLRPGSVVCRPGPDAGVPDAGVGGAGGNDAGVGGAGGTAVTDGGVDAMPDAPGSGGATATGGAGGAAGAASIGTGGRIAPGSGGVGGASASGGAGAGTGGAATGGAGGAGIAGAPGSGGAGAGSGGAGSGGTGTGGAGTGGAGTGGMIAGTGGTGGMIAGTGGRVGSGGAGGSVAAGCAGAMCTCADYCNTLTAEGCPTFIPSGDSCVATCMGFGWPVGPSPEAVSDQSDSLGCRINAAEYIHGMNCLPASPSGGGFCGRQGRCEVFCDAYAQNCAGAPDPFNGAGCMSACASFAWSNDVLTTTGTGGECFLYWAGKAGQSSDPDSRTAACRNAAPATTTQCK